MQNRGQLLYPHQYEAVEKMHNGCILCGGVGTGKSRTSLAYFVKMNGGDIYDSQFPFMNSPPDLYIITTARKRDTLEWEKELQIWHMSTYPDCNYYKGQVVVVDSWNNISKYADVKGAFFIFDEQRVVGHGEWSKYFIKIAKNNKWILLSATPGDKWEDYCSVFIANGFFRSKTEFEMEHIIFKRFIKYPVVDRYINETRLIRLRNNVLINMECLRSTVSHDIIVNTSYDKNLEKYIISERKNPWKNNEPIKNVSEFCHCLYRVSNEDESRQIALLNIVAEKHKAIIFYNYDYELDILLNLIYSCDDGELCTIAQYNGHCHQAIPENEHWVYLVQYNAGCEGWNCISTDTIIFYSMNYSYRIMTQAAGRINRLNTKYVDLYYYHLRSKAKADLLIARALQKKKKFNENAAFGKIFGK